MIPIVLFVYARPSHLQRTLATLRENRPPLLLVYSDGPALPEKREKVREVRQLIRAEDWCEVRIIERDANMGLGRSVMEGVTAALGEWESVLVCEDDLAVAPGAYTYLAEALRAYRDRPEVMSVTGWTQRRITPAGVGENPYFDGRAECLFWGTWRRAWDGMQTDALTLMHQCRSQGIDIYRYGADLRFMAERERTRNIWAVRFCFQHMLHRGLCLRPPWSMVEHFGWDNEATFSQRSGMWASPPLEAVPPVPARWPDPVEHSECSRLQRQALGGRPFLPIPFLWHYLAGRAYRRVRTRFENVRS